jgi:P27 family predicted phage terminase small subunit
MPGTATSGGRRTASKSRAQHERDGTFRKDRHADLKNPEPTAGRPEPPEELVGKAREEWDRMLWAFEDMGMLHKVDLFAVYQHCALYAETEAVKTQQEEAQAGLRVLEENLGDMAPEDKVALFGQIVALHKTVSKCTDQLRAGRMAIRQFLVEFGLTPASRGRIKLPAKVEQADEFTTFQQQRGAA